uniref:Lysosome-associated membrane glycoprotein 1 n=1 Tax=Leptobrachium leishanense TaxID=445787 RepID=A0A8C5M2C2_9ANUR
MSRTKLEACGRRRLGQCVRGMALLLVLGLFQVSNAASTAQFDVKDGNDTCILANLLINFTVDYKLQEKVAFQLPSNAQLDNSSTCGTSNTTPILAIRFGDNLLTLNFTKDSSVYKVDVLSFSYNLSDKSIFPNSTETGTKTVSSSNTAIFAVTDTMYKCSNPHLIIFENVNATFYDIKLEAYVKNNSYSDKATHCSEDIPSTTQPPSTTVTTAAPSPTPGNPVQGDYFVNRSSSEICLKAKVGLQLNITYSRKVGKDNLYVYNIDPQKVNVSGGCNDTLATLTLSQDKFKLSFDFALNSTKYYLTGVMVNTTLPADAIVTEFVARNDSLTYFETMATKSYKCSAKLDLQITSNFSLNTYNLQVQPFNVSENKFGPDFISHLSVKKNGLRGVYRIISQKVRQLRTDAQCAQNAFV